MKTKFTKGNWKIFNERVGVVDESDIQSHGMMQEVAYLDMYNFGEQEGKANAQLIACAPDMYEMLESTLFNEDLSDEYYNKIESLLKRARGE